MDAMIHQVENAAAQKKITPFAACPVNEVILMFHWNSF